MCLDRNSLETCMAISSNDAIHVLLVEDDEVDIQSVQREFRKMTVPMTLHVARDGAEAFDMLHGSNGKTKLFPTPQLIILDINMPKMNGIEFLEKLREESDFKYLTVYILTTAYTTRDKLATQNLKVAGYIVKPLQFDDVQHMYWSLL